MKAPAEIKRLDYKPKHFTRLDFVEPIVNNFYYEPSRDIVLNGYPAMLPEPYHQEPYLVVEVRCEGLHPEDFCNSFEYSKLFYIEIVKYGPEASMAGPYSSYEESRKMASYYCNELKSDCKIRNSKHTVIEINYTGF